MTRRGLVRAARFAAGAGVIAVMSAALPASATPPSPWRAQVSGEQEHLHGIFALDGCRAWALGEETGDGKVAGQAVIVATKDGGAHWFHESFPKDAAKNTTMDRVQFTDKNHGYAVGENNDVLQIQVAAPILPSHSKPNFLRSSNGGTTWVNMSSELPAATAGGTYNDIEGLSAIGQKVWITVAMYDQTGNSSRGLILYSSDRGDTWEIQKTYNVNSFDSVSMANGDQGWATSNDSMLWRTTDGGEHWNIAAATASSAEQVFAISGHKAVIAEDGGSLQYTLNGTTLLNATLPVAVNGNTLTDVAIGDDGHGYAIGELNGGILATSDGGKTWTWQDSTLPGNNFNGVTVARDTRFSWVTGEGGAIAANTDSKTSCDK